MPIPTQVAIPQIKWGKRKERSQMCEIVTSDSRIVDLELDALHGCVQNTKLATQDAYILSPENQFFDEEDGNWKQILNELSAIPICMIKPMDDVPARRKEIFKDARIAAMLQKQKDAAKSILWDKLTWIVTITFGSFIIIAAFQYFKGG